MYLDYPGLCGYIILMRQIVHGIEQLEFIGLQLFKHKYISVALKAKILVRIIILVNIEMQSYHKTLQMYPNFIWRSSFAVQSYQPQVLFGLSGGLDVYFCFLESCHSYIMYIFCLAVSWNLHLNLPQLVRALSATGTNMTIICNMGTWW